MDRRRFLMTAASGTLVSFALENRPEMLAGETTSLQIDHKTMTDKNPTILIAADPFAVTLKDCLVAHLKEKRFNVVDLGAKNDPADLKAAEIPYFESAPIVCRALQGGKADRAILLCGTGMGMSVIANRFKGVVASVVESVFAARMCRAINNANVLCLGAMIWGDWMAREAVDAFLETRFTEGLDPIADFLRDAEKKVEAIRD